MQRTQWIAAVALLVVAGALLAGRLALRDDVAPTAASSSDAASPADTSTTDATTTATTATTTAAVSVIDEPPRLGQAPEFRDIDGWLQTDAETLADFDGQVKIVEFWTFACRNCKATIPHLQGIYERWQPEGLEIIGVHSPEFDFEKEPDAVRQAAIDQGVTWPIVLDTRKTVFRDWQPGRRFWPRTFVVDAEGEIRYDHIGEGRYDELEATVAYLIENGP